MKNHCNHANRGVQQHTCGHHTASPHNLNTVLSGMRDQRSYMDVRWRLSLWICINTRIIRDMGLYKNAETLLKI